MSPAVHSTEARPVSPFVPSLSRIWRGWGALLLACAIAVALLGAWRGSNVAAALQRQEQAAVLQAIGSSIASNLERVQALGIPLGEAVGLAPWLASQTSASPLVAGLAITLASGELLAQQGMDPAILLRLRHPDADNPVSTERLVVSVAVKHAHTHQTVAWLHVLGTPRPAMWAQTVGALGLALLVAVAAAWALRAWLQRNVGRSLARIRQHLADIASGALVSGTVSLPDPGQHEVALLDQALAHQWLALQQRQAQLLQKLNEVRAAHFDNAVLARIDTLAAPLLCAPPDSTGAAGPLPLTRRGWRNWSLNRRVSAMLLAGWLLTLLALLTLHGLERDTLQRTQTHTQVRRLQAALDQRQAQDLARLDPLVQPAMAEAVLASGTAVAQAVLPAAAHWWMRAGQNASWDATGTGAQPVTPPRTVLDELANRREAVRGIWVGADDHHLRLGTGKAVALPDGSLASLVASQPLSTGLDNLLRDLGGHYALADHRGQAMGADPHGLVKRWQDANRLPVPPQGAADTWLLSLPLMSHSGHTLGHLVVAVPDGGWTSDASHSGQSGLLIVVGWLVLGALAWLVRQQLSPLGEAAREIARLAETPDRVAPDALRLDALHQDIARVENRLDVLRALRRSRERQGRRQARFIRHQMLELANRLDETARADVLKDLARIESAGLHPPQTPPDTPAPATELNPRFERMADEVGVLALGFQNLVGRVGDQYQQLGHLVQELREALRVKTQFIAIQQELEIARKMQLAFLPHDFSNQRGVLLHGMTQPAREVGGDCYDFFRLDEHHLAVLVADVSGKGVPAAFFMAVSRTLMRAVAQFSTGPADCLQRLNDLLAADNEELMFVTLFYAVLDTRTGALVYGNAGHNPPYVVRGNGQVEPVPILGDMALAVMPDMPYTEQRLQLMPGDALFLYTDGVTEASSPDGRWYGEPLLEAYLAHACHETVEAVNHGLVESVKQFEAGGAQSDDVTCLMVRFTPSADPVALASARTALPPAAP